jgi:hypothetical protein
MLRKLIHAGAIIALLMGPAAAQIALSPFKTMEKPRKTPEEIEKDKARDSAYSAAMQKIPEKKVADPWGNIRDTSPTPPKNKPQQ